MKARVSRAIGMSLTPSVRMSFRPSSSNTNILHFPVRIAEDADSAAPVTYVDCYFAATHRVDIICLFGQRKHLANEKPCIFYGSNGRFFTVLFTSDGSDVSKGRPAPLAASPERPQKIQEQGNQRDARQA